jgi:hypothetical protein
MPKPTKKKPEEKKKIHPRFTQATDKAIREGRDPRAVGGSFGYLGKPAEHYDDVELEQLGKGLIQWIKKDGNIWCKGYFVMELEFPMTWDMVKKLRARSPMFNQLVESAIAIQESKLVSEPYDHRKKKDGNHARFILARHHKQEWEDKPVIIQKEDEDKLDTTTSLIDHLQSKTDLNRADNKINNADKSILDTGIDNA